MLKVVTLALVLLVGLPIAAQAHPEADATAAASLQALQTIVVAAAVLLYATGVYRIRRRVGANRVVFRSQTFSFGLAAVLLVIALSSPVDDITDSLFSAHMAQHLALMLLIPPLAVWSRPVVVGLWAFPHGARKTISNSRFSRILRAIIQWLMQPLVVAILFLGTFSFWHLPRPYAWSLSNEWVHALEHLTFLVTAIMFWELVIEPSGRRRMGHYTTLLYVAAIAVLSGLPGALMILSPVALFKAHTSVTAVWGLTPLEDQQIAGLIMWIPAGLFFLIPIAVLFMRAMAIKEQPPDTAQKSVRLLVRASPHG
jgi:putative membrane protein